VNWYPNGDTTADPKPALVMFFKGRGITIRSIAPDTWGEALSSVHHLSDPMLKYRPNLKRDSGCWDFSDYDKQIKRELDAIRSALKTTLELIKSKEQGEETISLRKDTRRLAIIAKLQFHGAKIKVTQSTSSLEKALISLEQEIAARGERVENPWKPSEEDELAG
jgi:hypothetical protein